VAFQPDIIVDGPDGVALVVEAKTRLPNLGQTAKQLADYMIRMQCPTGILITPERMWLYRDLYSSPPDVEQIGEYDMHGLWPHTPPSEPASFERFVQEWLEHVAQQPIDDLPRKIGEAFQEYVFPAIKNGELRAAHPRPS
jgi:hypothetical protein